MLSASAATHNILLTSPNVLTADLYKFTLPTGTVVRWSGGDRPFTIGANTYFLGPLIKRTKTKRKVGVNVDMLTISIIDNGSVTLNGRSIMRSLQEGEFDGAIVEVERLFLSDWDDLTPGSVPWFFGYVSDTNTEQGKTEVRVKNMLGLLDTPMPRHLYMPSCNNTWGDASCTKDKIALTEAGTVGAGSTTKLVNINGHAHATNAAYFDLGVAKFNSGPNQGFMRTVRKHASGSVELSPALPVAPNSGDSIAIYPSCYKLRSSCVGYANEGRYRGFPYVPTPDTMYNGGGGVPGGSAAPGGTGQAPRGTGGGAYRPQRTYVK